MALIGADLLFEVNFLGDSTVGGGFADGTWEDVSEWVRGGTIMRGAPGASPPNWAAQAGSINLTLDNSDGRFDPRNTGSPYSPDVEPNRLVRATYENPLGFGQQLFLGVVAEWAPGYAQAGKVATVNLAGVDAVKGLSQVTLPAAAPEGAGDDAIGRALRVLGNVLDIASVTSSTHEPWFHCQATSFEQAPWAELSALAFTAGAELSIDRHGRVFLVWPADWLERPGRVPLIELEANYQSADFAYTVDDVISQITLANANGGFEWTVTASPIANFATLTRTDLVAQEDTWTGGLANLLLLGLASFQFRIRSATAELADDPALAAVAANAEMGSIVSVTMIPPGMPEQVNRGWVRAISHTFTPASWQVTFELEDEAAWAAAQFLILDHATLGQLDNNRLGL